MAPKRSLAAKRRSTDVPLSLVERASQDIAYGRVSSDIQREEQTIETQKQLLIGDITSRDPSISGRDIPVSQQRKLVGQFWDDGVSGTIPFEDREQGRRLVNVICRYGNLDCDGRCGGTGMVVDTVWVAKLDRLARRLQILIEIESFFRKHGVGLRCLDYDINTKHPTGMLIFTILGAIAQWEREIILERTAGGKRTKAAEGKFMGGPRAFGLKTDENGYLVVDETIVGDTGKMAHEIVREVFENIINGSSIDQEALRYGMSERVVGYLLHNPRYKGESGMWQAGEWIQAERNKPPQLVSPETWELAQERLLDNRRLSSRNRKYVYLVSQLMTCAESTADGICKRVFVGRIVRGPTHGSKYTYYCCYRKDCTARPLRGAVVEAAVWAEVRKRLLDPEAFLDEALSRSNQADKVRELRMDLTAVLDRLSKLNSERLGVLRNMDREGGYTEAEGASRLAEIREANDALTDRRSTLEVQLRAVNNTRANLRQAGIVPDQMAEELDRIEALAQSTNEDEQARGREQQRVLINDAIDRIEVRTQTGGGSKLQLFWKFGETAVAQDLSVVPTRLASLSSNQQPILIVTELDLPATCGQGRRTDLEKSRQEPLSPEEVSGTLT